MDYSLAYGLSQFEIEDPNFILPDNIFNPTYNDTNFVSSNLESYTNNEPSLYQQCFEEGETLVIKTAYEKLCSSNQVINTNPSTSTYTNFIAFGCSSSTPLEEHQYDGSLVREMPEQIFEFSSNASEASLYKHCHAFVCGDQEMKIDNSTMHKSPLQVQEHVVAERLRRQKLNKLFISLSANIPGLKKLDKASILKDAIEYIKQLQEHSKALEEEASKQSGKPKHANKIRMTDEIDKSDYHSSVPISDIKARFCGGEILIRMHCKNPKKVTLKLLGELEKLHLTIINCSVIPFDESHDITIIAQRSDECGIPGTELVENVKSAILKLV